MLMPDRDVEAFIERIISDSRIPRRRQRDEVRRELRAHFEDAGDSAEALADAVRRFGDLSLVTDSWQRTYRVEYLLCYVAKIAASIVASIAAALLIEVLVNVRVEVAAEVWRLAPGFSHAAALAVAVVLAVVAVREAIRTPVNWRRALLIVVGYAAVASGTSLLLTHSIGVVLTATVLATLGYASTRIAGRTPRLLLTFAAFAVAEYTLHWLLRVNFGAARALAASAVLVAVWVSTVAIMTRIDRRFEYGS
jgi:hypothetical protein